jgi:hypothetical protein
VELHDQTWHHDVDGLVRSLRGEPVVPANPRRRWLAAGTALIALLALGAGAWLLWGPGTGGPTGSGSGVQTGSATPLSCQPPAGQGWNPIALSKTPSAVDRSDPARPLKFTVTGAQWRAHGGKWQVALTTTVENIGHRTASMGYWWYEQLYVAQRPNELACFTPTSDTLAAGAIDDERVGFDVNCKPGGRIDLKLQGPTITLTPGTLQWGSC